LAKHCCWDFGFFGISIVTGINKSYVAPFLGTDFGLKANE